jgi:uncharacterized protein (TIGR02246 family)
MDTTPAVLAVLDDMFARFNEKDAAAFTEVFADDADFTDVLGQTAHGKAEIEAQHRFPFTRTMRDASLAADRIDVRGLGPDAAVAIVRWTSIGNVTPDGAPIPPRKGAMQVVLTRSGGTWRIVSVLNQDPMGVFGKQLPQGSGFKAPGA